MKRYQKIIILIILSSTIYLVYLFTDHKTITYLSLGDALSMGENSFGGITYGYEDYFTEYLSKDNETIHIDYYTSKNKNIEMLHNDILQDKTIILDNNNYNIKKSLQESDIITISIGLNDLVYEYSITNKLHLTDYEETRIVKYIYNRFKSLMSEIRKYTKRKVYIIGYPEKNVIYKNLIKKLNNKYNEFTKKDNSIFINTNKLLNREQYFDNNNSLYPNTKGYEIIAQSLINIYRK
ncbi:MAG: SGNH/GDSL hydrolase family protein [Bacilli bacterium]|nr:SGNH/GDSL hydrolase family protein [Bacilli bacterium]